MRVLVTFNVVLVGSGDASGVTFVVHWNNNTSFEQLYLIASLVHWVGCEERFQPENIFIFWCYNVAKSVK